MFRQLLRLLVLILCASVCFVSAESIEGCPADIAFLIDDSGSVSDAEMEAVKNFTITFTDLNMATSVGPGEQHQLGLARFSDAYELICLFVDHENIQNFTDAAEQLLINRMKDITMLGPALQKILCSTASAECIFGGPGDRPSTKNVLILITDGAPTGGATPVQDAIDAAYALKAAGVQICVIGVGVSSSTAALLRDQIATAENYVNIASVDLLGEATAALRVKICADPAPTTLPAPTDPTVEICKQCLERDQQRTHFKDPSDCHRFLICFYNETGIETISMPCPPNQYWNDYVLTCVPDVLGNCTNPCSAFVNPEGGIYEWAKRIKWPINACTYLLCDNSYGVPMCCADGTALVEFGIGVARWYECLNETAAGGPLPHVCNATAGGPDNCDIPWYPPPQTTQPAVFFPNGSCVDNWDCILTPYINSSDPDADYKFLLGGKVMLCPDRTLFINVDPLCGCFNGTDHLWPVLPHPHCLLFIDFDEPTYDALHPDDRSVYNRWSIVKGSVTLAPGQGILGTNAGRFQNGRIEVSGMHSVDVRNDASYCGFFACETNQCDGGFMSNSGGVLTDDWSVRVGGYLGDIAAHLQLYFPAETVIAKTTLFTPKFPLHHFCAILENPESADGDFVWKLWVDGILVDSQLTAGGDIKIVHCPFVIGTDHLFGNFTGLLDELLVCDHALTDAQRIAHSNHNMVALNLP